MNITESTAWYSVLQGLRTAASAEEHTRALDAVALLTERASATLGAGRRPVQAQHLVEDVLAAVEVASDHELFPQIVDWSARRPVDNVHAAGGVL